MTEALLPKPYGLIYCATNSVNGKVYIGLTRKALKIRISGHLAVSKAEKRKLFQNAIRKYGIESFVWEILEECFSKEDLMQKEIFYIEKYQAYNKEKGYNLSYGGEGCGRVTPETRNKISASGKGRRVSKETRQKQSESHKKRYENLRSRGIKWLTRLDNGKEVQQLNLGGEVIKEFSAIAQASRESGLSVSHISDVCRGVQKTAGGFIWRFKNESDRPKND